MQNGSEAKLLALGRSGDTGKHKLESRAQQRWSIVALSRFPMLQLPDLEHLCTLVLLRPVHTKLALDLTAGSLREPPARLCPELAADPRERVIRDRYGYGQARAEQGQLSCLRSKGWAGERPAWPRTELGSLSRALGAPFTSGGHRSHPRPGRITHTRRPLGLGVAAGCWGAGFSRHSQARLKVWGKRAALGQLRARTKSSLRSGFPSFSTSWCT